MISEKQITKFQLIYKAKFGKTITKAEANEKGAELIRLVGIAYQPMTIDEYNRLQISPEESNSINN